jgi:hypothetical protein
VGAPNVIHSAIYRELRDVARRPSHVDVLAKVTPVRGRGRKEQRVASSASVPQSDAAAVRAWWRERLAGAEQFSLPDLATEAVEHFAQDPAFVQHFFREFVYDVMYDAGMQVISQWRGGHGEQRWFERGRQEYAVLAAMSPEDLDHAIGAREHRVAGELERIEELREVLGRVAEPEALPAGVPETSLYGHLTIAEALLTAAVEQADWEKVREVIRVLHDLRERDERDA